MDLDFANIRAYPPKKFPGLIVLRLGIQDKYHLLNTLSSVIPLLEKSDLSGQLWIVEENRVRVRSQEEASER